MALVGCPFCHEMFPEEETSACPTCGMALRPVEKLPPSYEARVAAAAELAAVAPEDRTLPLWYWRRGRGALVLIAALGLAAYFAPWVEITRPEEVVYSAYHLGRVRGGWFHGAAVGWFVTIPLVLSRRTVYKMRGVRIITAMFAALSLIEAVQLLLNPPHHAVFTIEYEWRYGLFATIALGALGVLFGARFGGRLDDIDAREFAPVPEPDAALSPDASDERTIH